MKGIFDDLADMKRWVPYRLKYNPKREKFDKIPHTGAHGLSTALPTDWMVFTNAWEASEGYGLSGVGIVMTGGIELAGWKLIGLDFDDVKFEKFQRPFDTYAEKSPSGLGVRMFVWVPIPWANRFRDSTVKYPHCDHCEVYMGTAPRFLTITFNVLHETPIAQLQGADLKKLEKLGLLPAVDDSPSHTSLPTDPGKLIDLKRHDLSPEQRHLVDGTGNIDRSAVLHGLIIKLIDSHELANDVLATIAKTPALWAYCMSHRHDDPTRAADFAKEEVSRAYVKSRIGMQQKLIAYNADWDDPEKKTKPKTGTLAFPEDLLDNAPGLVGEIAKWILQASYAPRKEFAYAAALSMTACLIGPYCTAGSRDGKLNLYLVLVGGTGTGKNEAIDPMGVLLSATEAKDCITDFPASEAALRRRLGTNPNMLIRMDELAHKLESMKDNSNGNLMGKAILEMYNGARLPPKEYADEKKTLPAVENPFVQILGGTTEKIWEVVRTGHMEDGTLNRFIFVSLLENPEYSCNPNPSYEIKKELKDKINAFWRKGKMYDMIGRPDMGRHVSYTPEVEKSMLELREGLWAIQQKEYGALYTRFVQNTLKIATILAVGDNRLTVEMRDYAQARRFMQWSVDNTCKKANMYMADTNFTKLTNRLKRHLEKAGGRMKMRDVCRAMTITRRELADVLDMLQMSEEIDILKDDTPNINQSVTEWVVLRSE